MLKLLLLFWWNESCIYFSPFPLPFFPFFVSAKSMCSGWAKRGEAFAHWLDAQWELCSSCVGAHSGSCVFWKNPHSGSCVQVGNLKLGSLKLGESKCFMILQNMMLGKLKAKTLWWLLRTLHFLKKKRRLLIWDFQILWFWQWVRWPDVTAAVSVSVTETPGRSLRIWKSQINRLLFFLEKLKVLSNHH